MIAIGAFLAKNWRLAALGASLAAVLGFVALSLHWHKQAVQYRSERDVAVKALKACNADKQRLTDQIKAQAVEEGKRYEKTEADHLAACHDAYVAGAKRLRDDQAVKAGRYMPKSGASPSGR